MRAPDRAVERPVHVVVVAPEERQIEDADALREVVEDRRAGDRAGRATAELHGLVDLALLPKRARRKNADLERVGLRRDLALERGRRRVDLRAVVRRVGVREPNRLLLRLRRRGGEQCRCEGHDRDAGHRCEVHVVPLVPGTRPVSPSWTFGDFQLRFG